MVLLFADTSKKIQNEQRKFKTGLFYGFSNRRLVEEKPSASFWEDMHGDGHLHAFMRVGFFFFHLLHPVLSAFAGVLMPDVVGGVGEGHGAHSALHVHLPLIHLPGSTICISSYLHGATLKNTTGRSCKGVALKKKAF